MRTYLGRRLRQRIVEQGSMMILCKVFKKLLDESINENVDWQNKQKMR